MRSTVDVEPLLGEAEAGTKTFTKPEVRMDVYDERWMIFAACPSRRTYTSREETSWFEIYLMNK